MTSFDDAVRRYFGAPPEAQVSSKLNQSGDDGCDTCGMGRTPASVELNAYLWERTPSGRISKKKGNPQRWHAEFTDLPALWEVLFPDD